MQIISKSEIGNVREINQDYVTYKLLSEDEAIAVLCDGMGGHKAGEVASQLTCEYIIDHFEDYVPFESDEDIKKSLQKLIHDANQFLMQKSTESEDYDGMGTTVVVCYVKGDSCYVSHVGDSRCYYCNQDQIVQLTRDDTLVNALVDYGTITKEEAKFHPRKNILLQAVGATEVLKISFCKQDLSNGLILLCSDGLNNSLYDQQLHEILISQSHIEEKASKLIEQSLEFGGNDNISFIILDKGELKHE